VAVLRSHKMEIKYTVNVNQIPHLQNKRDRITREFVQVGIQLEYISIVVVPARKTGSNPCNFPASPHFGKKGVITGNLRTW